MKDMDLKAPMLGPSRNGRGGGRLSRRSYSVKSLKKDFVLRLPDKLRSAGDFDPESETFGPDLSTISGLTKGLSLSLSLSLSLCVFDCLVYQQNAGKEQKENGVSGYVYIICTLHRNAHTIEQNSLVAIKENVRFCSVLFVFYTFT